MLISALFQEILKETKERFDEHKDERSEKAKLIEQGRISEANDPNLIERRIARVIGAQGAGSQPAQRGLERVMGTNDLMSIRFFEDGIRKAKAVARVHIRTPQGTPQGFGTGFLVSPRLLLTNHHVLSTKDSAVGSLAEFNYQLRIDGELQTSTTFSFAPDDFFLSDKGLDYALVAVRPTPELERFGWLHLIEDTGKLIIGEWVNIIQHPNGEPKQLAIRENRVIDELDLYLHYVTDTAPGSSGSPVFNDQWEVVALHHSGVPKTQNGQIMAVDNRPWEPWMGEHRIAWEGNEGIRVSKLVTHIKNQSLDTSLKKKLRTELLEAIPPAPTGPEVEAAKPPLSKPDGGIDSPFSMQPVVDRRGSATWTIPLQVSVTVGGFDGPEPVHNAAVTPSVVAPTITQALVATADAGENTELRAALEELASAGSRVYYDEAGDQAAVDAYYAAIRANASGKTLFESLSRLVQSTHATELTYRPAVHLYPWIDLHPDLKVRSIYSGRDFAAEALIREDFRIDEARAERLREMMVTESTNSTVRIREALDLLEASLPYNCEHVVPQSWFMKREPMRGDLHHLFACETGCNSFRGNTPYYDFPDFEEAVRDACGKRAEDKFEPQRGKGAVARAVLYFLLRYPKQVGDDGREMQDDRLPILLEWHRQNPPDAYEKHRNAAIFEKQGNRNPLIDRPEWADKIDFSLGFS